MKNIQNIENNTDATDKSSQRNYKFLIIFGVLLIFVSFVLYLRSYYLTDSKKVIRNAAAESLNKNPNKFGWLDYSKVIKLDLSGKELSDLRYISKFKNLKHLSFENIIGSRSKKIPKWKEILQKFHIIKPKPQQNNILFVTGKKSNNTGAFINRYVSQEELIDLSPLKKLKKLQSLNLSNKNSGKICAVLSLRNHDEEDILINTTIPFKNIKPLSNLTTLKTLNLNNIHISNLEPIKNLKNLQNLSLSQTNVIDLTHLKNLTNFNTLFLSNTPVTNIKPINELMNLKDLYIGGTQVTSLEPLKGLSNLRELEIDRTKVSDLEPVKGLKNLKELWMYQCEKITDEQVEDLQHALPNLKIYRHLSLEN